jgi:hypothetical protein
MGAVPDRKKRKRVIVITLFVMTTLAIGAFLAFRTRSSFESIQCGNTLSSLGVAARLYAQDSGGTYAPNVRCQ